jgi:DNA-directed RNA polymerase specialized sigma24 family protein
VDGYEQLMPRLIRDTKDRVYDYLRKAYRKKRGLLRTQPLDLNPTDEGQDGTPVNLGPEDFRELAPDDAAEFNGLIDKFIESRPEPDRHILYHMIKENLSIGDMREQFGVEEDEVHAVWRRAVRGLRGELSRGA